MLPAGVACYLINLDRSPQRLAAMQARLAELGIAHARIAAVDGAQLTDEEFLRHTVENRYYKPIRRGEVGCYLSHLKVLQAFLASDAHYALILEDDCLFDANFNASLQAAIALRDDARDPLLQWDVLKLNRKRRRWVVLAPLAVAHQLVEYGLSVPITTAAAVWTRAAAERFLRAHRGATRPIDCDLQHPWEFGLNILALQPPPVTQGDVASTIGNRKHPAHGPLAKLGYELRRLWPKLRHFGQRYGWGFIAGWLWRRQLHYRQQG
ncbi:MAG TPA: glycosyltransferase family 25 protein [Casimicrobium huifangae]|nr:glycosyltransferase family 25 protein [Casimicrobium huifangae]